MGLDFNRFSIIFQWWKNAISTFRIRIRAFIAFVLNFFFKFCSVGGNQKLKAWSFQLCKNNFCMLNIERPIAHQSSITFFLIHPVDTPCIWSSLILCDVKWYNVILLTMCHVWYRGIPRFPSSCTKIISKWLQVEKIWWDSECSILSLFQGNMLYLIWVIVEEYLGCQCRWGFGTVSQCLVRSFCMKFCLNLTHVHCGTMRY